MAEKTLREEIANTPLKYPCFAEGHEGSCSITLGIRNANSILIALEERIKAIPNPFPNWGGFVSEGKAFESCREAILKVLKGE